MELLSIKQLQILNHTFELDFRHEKKYIIKDLLLSENLILKDYKHNCVRLI